MEALMGREVEDREINAEFHSQLIGKGAVADLEETKRDDGSPRISILRLSPRKKAAAPVAAPTPVREPEYAQDLQDVAF
jgi:hypothetical protein